MEREREKGLAEGRTEGCCLSVLALLEELGQIPSSLRKKIMEQKDLRVLTGWLKAAASASSLEDFIKAAKL